MSFHPDENRGQPPSPGDQHLSISGPAGLGAGVSLSNPEGQVDSALSRNRSSASSWQGRSPRAALRRKQGGRRGRRLETPRKEAQAQDAEAGL